MIDTTQYSIVEITQVTTLLEELKKLENDNSDLVDFKYDVENLLVAATHKNQLYSHYFNIVKPAPQQKSNPIKYHLSFKPFSAQSVLAGKYIVAQTEILAHFNEWRSFLEFYDKLDLNKYKGDFTKVFEKEIYEEFKILDEDAQYMPFEQEKLDFLYAYLTYVEEVIRSQPDAGEPEMQELASTASELKENLQRSPKAEVVRKISRLMAKAKTRSLKLLNDFADVSKKEGLKYVLFATIHELPTIANHVKQFFNALPPIVIP